MFIPKQTEMSIKCWKVKWNIPIPTGVARAAIQLNAGEVK